MQASGRSGAVKTAPRETKRYYTMDDVKVSRDAEGRDGCGEKRGVEDAAPYDETHRFPPIKAFCYSPIAHELMKSTIHMG